MAPLMQLWNSYNRTTVNIYDFQRVVKGEAGRVGSYTHTFFVRGKPSICQFMVRTKIKNRVAKRNAPKPSSKPTPKSSSKFKEACTDSSCTTVNSKSCAGISRSMIDEDALSFPYQDTMQLCDENSGSGSPLERLLFNSDEKVQSIHNNDPTADTITSCDVDLSRTSQFDFQAEMGFNGSVHYIISSQSSTANDVSSLSEESGAFSSAEDSIATIPCGSDVCAGMFRNQCGQPIADLHEQQHDILSDEYRRPVDLKQHQVQLKQEDYKRLTLQKENLGSQVSALSCCEELHVQRNGSYSSNQDDFWKSIENMDLNPTPIFTGSNENFTNNDSVNVIERSVLVRRISFNTLGLPAECSFY